MLTIWLLIRIAAKCAEKADFSDDPYPISDIFDD